MTDLPSLIAALEASDGPSRELDHAIGYAIGMGNEKERKLYAELGVAMWEQDRNGLSPYDKARGDTISSRRIGRSNRFEPVRFYACDGPSPLTSCLSFTNSIDAALTLIPEGWDEHCIIHWPGYDNGKWMNHARVDLHHIFSSGGGPRVKAFAATPALAICIAALRARQEGEG